MQRRNRACWKRRSEIVIYPDRRVAHRTVDFPLDGATGRQETSCPPPRRAGGGRCYGRRTTTPLLWIPTTPKIIKSPPAIVEVVEFIPIPRSASAFGEGSSQIKKGRPETWFPGSAYFPTDWDSFRTNLSGDRQTVVFIGAGRSNVKSR